MTKYVDPNFRDGILGKIIEWTTNRGVTLSLKEMTSFDPQYDDNYEENWNKFIKDHERKQP